MRKLLVIAASVAVLPALIFAPTASAAGQIEGGDIYRVANLTQNIDFTDPVNATCGDTVQFKVRIHNPGPDPLTSVKVTATNPSGTGTSFSSQVTISAPAANPGSTTDTAGVKSNKQAKLAYVSGSTELLDANGSKLSTLGDTLFTPGGVTIDAVGVSLQQRRYVQFKASLSCVPTPPKQIKVCELATKKVVTIDEDDFDASKHSTDLSKCASGPTPVAPTTPTKPPTTLVATPTTLVKTGPGEIAALFAVVATLGAVAYSRFFRRQM